MLKPTAATAPRVLLPGDPGRALVLAQDLLTSPLMSNHNRGLWGYTGTTATGAELTIQSSGVGGPSIAAVVSELATAGVTSVIRIGTCAALGGGAAGEVIVVTAASSGEGSSRALNDAPVVRPDAALTDALARQSAAFARGGDIVSTDLLYGPGGEAHAPPERDGAIAADLGTATLFALGAAAPLAVAAILVVARDGGAELPDETLDQRFRAAGRAAAAALETVA